MSNLTKVVEAEDALERAMWGVDVVGFMSAFTKNNNVEGDFFSNALYWVSIKIEEDIAEAKELLNGYVGEHTENKANKTKLQY